MNIYKIQNAEEIKQSENSVLVLGYFDALHKGHQQLFEQAKKAAAKEGLRVAVLTFPESPQLVFSRYNPSLLDHINFPQKRYAKFAEYGVDDLYLIDFTSHFAKLSSDDFIETYIKALKAKKIVVGFDYKFGYNQADSDYLKRNFQGDIIVLPEVQYEGSKISSTRIRSLIQKGDVRQVEQLLGYAFSTRGIVVHGDARGRTIGFPTANLALIDRTFLPSDGVYVTDALVSGRRYRSMTSIGKNITFGGTELRIEANIFDFDGDIYGETIEIFWLDRIREMTKFNGVDDLVTQLKSDEEIARNFENS
ncbi:bifunctional riboflavin kinase/FAD synthetase [Streptococcus macacae]|nr:bifunctional riboflavin kinase/FAD synthetase [Streptococcus macacae]